MQGAGKMSQASMEKEQPTVSDGTHSARSSNCNIDASDCKHTHAHTMIISNHGRHLSNGAKRVSQKQRRQVPLVGSALDLLCVRAAETGADEARPHQSRQRSGIRQEQAI